MAQTAISSYFMPQISRFSSLSRYIVQLRVGENGFCHPLLTAYISLSKGFDKLSPRVKRGLLLYSLCRWWARRYRCRATSPRRRTTTAAASQLARSAAQRAASSASSQREGAKVGVGLGV